MLTVLQNEIFQRKNELENQDIQTVYFGGGTPSILTVREIEKLVSVISKTFRISASPEITLEGNPDDLNKEYLGSLKQNTPVNRLSIGVQSFHDRDLHYLNRIHTSNEAIRSIQNSLYVGFTNINIDLIYGIPTLSTKQWKNNLKFFKQLGIPHLSAYHLTIEPHTVFAYFRKKGLMKEVPEEKSINQFRDLIQFAEEEGYEHYEISNFARPGYHSKHNMGYWTHESYLGFGPSAHSFDGVKRRWNIANNTRYIHSIENNIQDYFEFEFVDARKAYNEYIMTALRTMWGIDLKYLEKQFGKERFKYLLYEADSFIKDGTLLSEFFHLRLSKEGKLISDYVISELMAI